MAQTDSNPDKLPKTPPRRSAAPVGAAAAAPAGAPPAKPSAASLDGPVIGFNELRQACEISALREDLARLGEETESLCDHIEEGVEQVRKQVAGLCAEELADPDVMAPLLQFAVGTLIAIRDRAREIDTRVGAADDDVRPDWTVASPSPRTTRPAPSYSAPSASSSPAPSAPSPPAPLSRAQVPPEPVPSAPVPSAVKPPPISAPPPSSVPPPRSPPPLAPVSAASEPASGGSWLAPPAAAGANRSAPGHAAVPGSAPRRAAGPVDWLGPARK